MVILSNDIAVIVWVFRPLFSERVWDWAQILSAGASLAPGWRIATAVWRVMGLCQEPQFQNYHRALNRAKWSGLQASRILLGC
jgi:hypothetical protein